jgi:hypothetical protein
MSKRSHRRYLPLQMVGPGLFIRLCDSAERQKAFRKMFVTAPFYEDVCILHNLTNPIIRQLSYRGPGFWPLLSLSSWQKYFDLVEKGPLRWAFIHP